MGQSYYHVPILLIFAWFCCQTQVGNLGAPVEDWTVGGTALTALMDVERRHGI